MSNTSIQESTPQPTELATISQKFVSKVEKQFSAELGSGLEWTPLQQALAQHLFIKVDATLKALEAKRLDSGRDSGKPITWANINMPKLAIDAVHRVSLGLDALIQNHIHPIPYFNKRLGLYDLDLRVGYVGKIFCRSALAIDPPRDVVLELVYDSDTFVPHKKSLNNETESYEFKINKPFERGKVIGGFGYVAFNDHRKNYLVIVTDRDFAKARQSAQTQDFWAEGKFEREMQFKTLVHRVGDKIPLDPAKVNAVSFAYIEAQELDMVDAEIAEAAALHANGEVIDLVPAIAPTSTSVILSPVEGAASGEDQEGANGQQKEALPF